MTPDPNAAAPFWPYAVAAVVFVTVSAVALVLMAAAWHRFEDWLNREATVTPVYPNSGPVRVMGKDGAA